MTLAKSGKCYVNAAGELLALGCSADSCTWLQSRVPITAVNFHQSLRGWHSLTASDLIAQRPGSPGDLAASSASSPFHLPLSRCAVALHPCMPPPTQVRIDLEDHEEYVSPRPVHKRCRRASSEQPAIDQSLHERQSVALTL